MGEHSRLDGVIAIQKLTLLIRQSTFINLCGNSRRGYQKQTRQRPADDRFEKMVLVHFSL